MSFKKQFFYVTIIGFVVLLIALLAVFISINSKESKKDQTQINKNYKNIIFIVADDLGWSDLGYASGEAITPTIDRLATEGIILNQTYTYSMCTPSRSAILTGVFTERTGLQHFVLPNSNPVGAGIPLSFSLMPEYLRKYGYKTHIVGKWHVGSCSLKLTPAQRGFDSFYGFFYGEENYYTHRVNYIKGSGLDFWDQTSEYLKPILDKNNTYSTYAFNERALNIIDNHDTSKPLFLFYAAQNPHSDENFNVPKSYEDLYKHIENSNRRKILGMITLFDDAIANLTKALDKKSMLDNTIIAFTSDNGGDILDFQRNFPLRGGKSGVFEGGHRVRAFINMKGLTPSVYDDMFHSVDWVPTILSGAIGQPIDIENIDGVNQWDSIVTNSKSKRDSFIYNIDPIGARHGSYRCNTSTEAIRLNDWKLILGCPGILTDWYNLTDFDPFSHKTDPGEFLSVIDNNTTCNEYLPDSKLAYFLFNLKDDPVEKINLASKYPCKVLELEKKLQEYKKISVEPQIKEPLEAYRDEKADPAKWGDKWSPGWC